MASGKTEGGGIYRLSASKLYEIGQSNEVRLDARLGAIVLDDWTLLEDDADGAGHPYVQDVLTGETRIRKDLVLDVAGARAARLVIYHTVAELWRSKPYEARVQIAVNGHAQQATLAVGWNVVAIDPGVLIPGTNQVVLSTPSEAMPAIIPIAARRTIVENLPWRDTQAQRSFKSKDGGKSWSDQLGEADNTPGEYMIRLHLQRHVASGMCVSPVLDLLDIERKHAIKSLARVESLALRMDGESPAGTALECSVRTGPTPVFDPAAWGQWRRAGDGQRWTPRGRYCQIKCLLSTDDPLKTPALRGLTLEVQARAAGSGGMGPVRVELFDAPSIVRSSLPFGYESLNHASLKELRRRYRLDDVVAGAKSQWEHVLRLNHWVSCQWKWHEPVNYPQWNALEILEKQPNGESRGGFCGHYAIVLVQCCLAMGIQARFVFGDLPGVIGGHEVVEFWSDDFGKWVLMDPNMDRYYLSRANSEPMNALDIHRAILRHYFVQSAIGRPQHNLARFEAQGLEQFLGRGPFGVHNGNDAGPDWFDPRKAHLMWGIPRMMPGNAFFSQPHPMPRAHGYGLGWAWNRYYHWFDNQTPREDRYGTFTDREADFYWSLNQVDLFLEQVAEPGVLRVTAETFTPDLEALLVSFDDGPWTVTPAQLTWKLHGGPNSLQVRTRNVGGVEGRPSSVKIVAPS